ncbi:MAG TPA: amino acid racemase [Vicinamibacterales bacterium]|nr:amino acid racemase [Vicinamibacterales bacterium]
MHTLGIVGGIAPESTIDYYRQVIARYRERRPDGHYPAMVINSIDLRRMLDLVAAGDRPALVDYLSGEIARLGRAGATLGLLASNTPHLVFDDLQQASPIPLISIVEAAARAAEARGLERLALLGTRFTMEGGFYQDAFRQGGMTVVVPAPAERELVHDIYMTELVAGVFRQEARDAVLAIVERLRRDDRVEGVILGGTELPLLLRDAAPASIPFLDTTAIHVDAAVAKLLS